MPRTLATDAALTDTKDGAPVAQLAAGEIFEVLEITAAHAWGVAPGNGRVGFIPLAALTEA